jgi:hypothetical protein
MCKRRATMLSEIINTLFSDPASLPNCAVARGSLTRSSRVARPWQRMFPPANVLGRISGMQCDHAQFRVLLISEKFNWCVKLNKAKT